MSIECDGGGGGGDRNGDGGGGCDNDDDDDDDDDDDGDDNDDDGDVGNDDNDNKLYLLNWVNLFSVKVRALSVQICDYLQTKVHITNARTVNDKYANIAVTIK